GGGSGARREAHRGHSRRIRHRTLQRHSDLASRDVPERRAAHHAALRRRRIARRSPPRSRAGPRRDLALHAFPRAQPLPLLPRAIPPSPHRLRARIHDRHPPRPIRPPQPPHLPTALHLPPHSRVPLPGRATPPVWTTVAIYAFTLFAVAIPLKIWNNTRNEKKLEEQDRLLVEARLAALTSQINPHFLFNTLNSVSSLIRTDPNQARVMVLRLSKVLRRLLRKHENFTSLRDELGFIDDYLAIETVRFGEKLRFERDIADDTLDMLVPSMLLQPLVENSIKHGLSKKVEGGTIRIRTFRTENRLHLLVEDDGVGIPEEKLATLLDR